MRIGIPGVKQLRAGLPHKDRLKASPSARLSWRLAHSFSKQKFSRGAQIRRIASVREVITTSRRGSRQGRIENENEPGFDSCGVRRDSRRGVLVSPPQSRTGTTVYELSGCISETIVASMRIGVHAQ